MIGICGKWMPKKAPFGWSYKNLMLCNGVLGFWHMGFHSNDFYCPAHQPKE